MPGGESSLAANWINTTLDTDVVMTGLVGASGIWDGTAEKGATYPLVEFEPQSPGVTIKGVSTVIIGLNMLWKVVGVCSGKSYDPVEPVAAQIDLLLHGVVEYTFGSGIIMSCVREQDFRLESVQGGQDYRYLGGLYRVLAQTN